MTADLAPCDGCGAVRPLRELLIVSDRHDPARAPWFACRSSYAGRGDCLARSAGHATDYAIALADPSAEAVTPPRLERPAPAPLPVERHYPGRLIGHVVDDGPNEERSR